MTYAIAKQVAQQLNDNYDAAIKTLKAIDGVGTGPMGLTPDAIKFGAEYRAAKAVMDKAFADLRKFNSMMTKQYKKEINAEQKAKRNRMAV